MKGLLTNFYLGFTLLDVIYITVSWFLSGCAIYTGQETKMALNSRYKAAKFSRIEG